MSVGLYDAAFLNKLLAWTKDTHISVLGPSDSRRLFEMVADNNNDSPIQLPLIALSRPSGFSLLHATKQPLSFDGATLSATHERASQMNLIPISIPYQLDVYTRYQNEADEYIRNLVFNIINYPKLEILIPYNNENRIHDSNIRIVGDVDDNSDIPEHLISGQFTRYSLRIEVDDAYLFDIRYRDVYRLDIVTDMTNKSIEDVSKEIKLV